MLHDFPSPNLTCFSVVESLQLTTDCCWCTNTSLAKRYGLSYMMPDTQLSQLSVCLVASRPSPHDRPVLLLCCLCYRYHIKGYKKISSDKRKRSRRAIIFNMFAATSITPSITPNPTSRHQRHAFEISSFAPHSITNRCACDPASSARDRRSTSRGHRTTAFQSPSNSLKRCRGLQ